MVQVYSHGSVLELIKVFQYLGCLFGQDNDDAQAIWQQMRKARGLRARVGQVLHGENVMPCVAAKFYKAVVQAILLYGSKTWNLMGSALARLEGFYICVAYKMAQKYRLRRGANRVWVYPKLADVLEECRTRKIVEYICKQRDTIAVYVVTQPIPEGCKEGEGQRGLMPRQ